MPTAQVAFRIDETILEVARKTAARQNRSLSNYVETVLAESLMLAEGDRPILCAVDADLSDVVAINDDGSVNSEKTAVIRDLVTAARRI